MKLPVGRKGSGQKLRSVTFKIDEETFKALEGLEEALFAKVRGKRSITLRHLIRERSGMFQKR